MYSKIREILKDARVLLFSVGDDIAKDIRHFTLKYIDKFYKAQSLSELQELYSLNLPNIVIIDFLKDDDIALQVARFIRSQSSDVPVLLACFGGGDEGIGAALELGCAGVIYKPLNKRDLIISMSFALNKFRQDFASISLGRGYEFNSVHLSLSLNGKPIFLTRKEQLLLHLLLRNQTRIVSFEHIRNFVWQGDSCSIDAIRAFVYKLRKKLYPELITNAQGNGYQICINQNPNTRTITSSSYV